MSKSNVLALAALFGAVLSTTACSPSKSENTVSETSGATAQSGTGNTVPEEVGATAQYEGVNTEDVDRFHELLAQGKTDDAFAALATCATNHETSVAVLEAANIGGNLGLTGEFDADRAEKFLAVVARLIQTPILTPTAKDVLRVRTFATILRLNRDADAIAALAGNSGSPDFSADVLGEIKAHLATLASDTDPESSRKVLDFIQKALASGMLADVHADILRVQAFSTYLAQGKDEEAFAALTGAAGSLEFSAELLEAINKHLAVLDTGKAPEDQQKVLDFIQKALASRMLADEHADVLRARVFVSDMKRGDLDAALAGLAACGKTPAVSRTVRREISAAVRARTPEQIIPFLNRLVDCPWFRPADLIGQLVEDQFIRFAGDGGARPADVARLKDLLAFSQKLLDAKMLSEAAENSLRERRLDGFFLSNDFDGAIACLEREGVPSRSPAWCKGTAAKLRAHKAMEAGDKKEAVKQLLVFGDFMLSEEQKDFEDCDPTTGIVYSRAWVVARNYMRCSRMSREIGDAANADAYLAKAKTYFAMAHDKAKDDRKSLESLRDEMKENGLALPALPPPVAPAMSAEGKNQKIPAAK